MSNAQHPDLPDPQGEYGRSADGFGTEGGFGSESGFGTSRPITQDMPPPELVAPPARAPYPPSSGPSSSAPSRKGTSTLAGILGYAALAVACLVLATATFLFVADPAQILRDQITIRIKAATGRTLTIAGATRLSLYPSLGLTMRDVTLSAPPGMDGGPSVKMARLTASLQLLPLLKKRAVVERLILTRPQINLVIDRQGRRNWDLASARALTHPVRYAQANTAAQNAAGRRLPKTLRDFIDGASRPKRHKPVLAMLAGLSLDDVRIDNGTIHYTDERTGLRQSLEAVNLSLGLRDLSSPLHAAGDLTWNGRTVTLNASITSLTALLNERVSPVKVRLSSGHIDANYTGALAVMPAVELDGRLSATSGSIRQLAAWLGAKLPPASGFGAMTVKGALLLKGSRIDLTRAALSVDGATANGDLGITLGGSRPKIRALLKLSQLDLNKYLPDDGTASSRHATGSNHASRSGNTAEAPYQTISDLLGADARGVPQVRGYTKRVSTGWDNTPIDAGALRLVDADVKLNVGRILFRDLKIGASSLHAILKNAKLTASLADMQLYDGRGTGQFSIAARQSGINLSATISLTRISALPLLRDAMNFKRIDGRGNLKMLLSAEGRSQRQIMSSLLGNGRFTFTDGAIVGLNIPKLIRGLQNGQIGNLETVKSEKTDFSELSGTFQITNGIAQNNDLKLISPLLRMSGAGTVHLPERRLDYKLKPKIVASLSGQGATSPLSGIEIPVRVTGPWDKPKVAADLAALTANPSKTIETIRRIGKRFRGRDAKKALDNLLGGKGGGKELLKQLFR